MLYCTRGRMRKHSLGTIIVAIVDRLIYIKIPMFSAFVPMTYGARRAITDGCCLHSLLHYNNTYALLHPAYIDPTQLRVRKLIDQPQ